MRQTSSEALGHVKLMGNFPEVVPARNTVVLNGYVQLWEPCMEKWVTLLSHHRPHSQAVS